MVENGHLTRLRREFEQVRRSMTAIVDQLAAERRDPTGAELHTVIRLGERADTLLREIESLVSIEFRTTRALLGPRLPVSPSHESSRPARARFVDVTSDATATSSIIGSADGCG